jgi:outer membrane lipopolysaccharide assembly protein LptE/RlpB
MNLLSGNNKQRSDNNWCPLGPLCIDGDRILGGVALQRCSQHSFFISGVSRRGERPRDLRNTGYALKCAAVFALALTLAGCGYHTVGHADALPPNIRTIAIPGFVSHSQTFRIEQLLTDAVVREFNTRTQFRVVHDTKQDSDAVLKATVLSASATPLAYDSQTGRAASALVTVSIQVTLTDRQGKVVFQNPSYLFHDQYEISRDLASFFEEDSPAVDRLSRDFAHTLVANILEAY